MPTRAQVRALVATSVLTELFPTARLDITDVFAGTERKVTERRGLDSLALALQASELASSAEEGLDFRPPTEGRA